jgi:hypothetical protein
MKFRKHAQNPQNSGASEPEVGSVDTVYGFVGAEILLSELRSRGVELSIDPSGGLAFNAPKGVMTDSIVDRIRAHRDELVDLLERLDERAAIAQYGGGLSRSDAERLALAELLTKKHDVAPELAGVICPYCRSIEFEDVERGWRCRKCHRLAWVWLPGGSIVRADYEKTNLAFEP